MTAKRSSDGVFCLVTFKTRLRGNQYKSKGEATASAEHLRLWDEDLDKGFYMLFENEFTAGAIPVKTLIFLRWEQFNNDLFTTVFLRHIVWLGG